MKKTHEEYLKMQIEECIYESRHLDVTHKINVAVYEAKKEALNKQLDSLERHLSS